ncbi:hypothetical protein C7212DRAFT_323885 [Tuber magnatum]|uniref:Uncharacterized protein n=1 Tax=Tuber magnatum TaxID=42249 RepID=A0A317SL77_9PEZI|nr:hypothetical protein C7212DRAFT_323885 [Tuber magnatum]
MEEVRKEEVEGMKMVVVVDDKDFMIGGGNRKEVEERMRKMGRGLRRGLEKWEVDVQTMKLEAIGGDKFEDGSESIGSVVSE